MKLPDQVQSSLGADGVFMRQVPGFEPREAQLAFATGVAEAIEAGTNLVAEAGTGTGKTFAYLVPILLAGRRSVIATATRALQDQLYGHDLPVVTRALGRPLDVTVLKGRTNYLCRERLNQLQPELLEEARLDLEAVRLWDKTTATGDLAELPEVGERSGLKIRLTTDRHGCLGSGCPEYADCHLYKARQRAREADMVIVNHHLLLADRALQSEGFSLLGESEVVIVDEAHALPETARMVWGESVSFKQLDILAAAADKALAGRSVAARALRMALAESAPLGMGSYPRETLEASFIDRLGTIEEALSELEQELALLDRKDDEVLRRLRAMQAGLTAWMTGNSEDEQTASVSCAVEIGEAGAVSLNLRLLETSDTFAGWIRDSTASWIFSSATLAVEDDFSAFSHDLGLETPRTLKVGSSFDYARQARLYLPSALPDVDAGDYLEALLRSAEPLLAASGGGAFFLFTSRRALRQAAGLIRDWDWPYELFVQGEGARARQLEAFRTSRNGVLLGTKSFWEGVDVKGNALVLVVIDRLPFASPGEPVLKARIKRCRALGGNAFRDIQLPAAVMALKQGAGRLIRDGNDHGVLMIGDSRLQVRHYRKQFLHSLPPMPIVHEQDAVTEFLSRHTGVAECA
ncbi:MAG: ATP-dependent DNA helicase [Gammaproteobacteria bacterium]